jgi:hypothetical protein
MQQWKGLSRAWPTPLVKSGSVFRPHKIGLILLPKTNMSRLVNISSLSECTGIGVRTLRTFMAARKIPFLKCGHRTILFNPDKVQKALERFEVKAVGGNERCVARKVSNRRKI